MTPKQQYQAFLKRQAAIKSNLYKSAQPTTYQEPHVPTRSTINTGGEDYAVNVNKEQMILKQISAVDNRIKQSESAYATYDQLAKEAQLMIDSGGITNQNPIDLMYNMSRKQGYPMAPGNIGDINQVYWPFWYSTSKVTLTPGDAAASEFTVTQEAAFIITGYTKSVFKESNVTPGNFEYIDSDQAGAAGKIARLAFTFRDAVSSRVFHDKPMDINEVGYWRNPTKMSTPMLLLPNAAFEVEWVNNDANNTYVPYLTFYGVRVRVEKAREILGTVSQG